MRNRALTIALLSLIAIVAIFLYARPGGINKESLPLPNGHGPRFPSAMKIVFTDHGPIHLRIPTCDAQGVTVSIAKPRAWAALVSAVSARADEPKRYEIDVAGNKVKFLGREILGADAATFKPFDNYIFARDKNRAYLGESPVNEATLCDLSPWRSDGTVVYYESDKIPLRGTAKDFVILDPFTSLSTDGHQVFYRASATGADPATAERIEGTLWKDATSVFLEGKKLPDADPKSLRKVGDSGYFADAKFVYRGHVKLEGWDGGSFEPLHGGYAKDKNHVYCGEGILEGADPATFGATEDFRFRDRNSFYNGCEKETSPTPAVPDNLVSKPVAEWRRPETLRLIAPSQLPSSDEIPQCMTEKSAARKRPSAAEWARMIMGTKVASAAQPQAPMEFYRRDKKKKRIEIPRAEIGPNDEQVVAWDQYVPLKGADYATFKFEKGWPPDFYYASDKHHVYYMGKPIAGANSKTFRRAKGFYRARDGKKTFLGSHEVDGDKLCMRDDVRIITDGKSVFNLGDAPVRIALEGPIESFRVFEATHADSLDDREVYSAGKPLGADPKTLLLTDHRDWMKDARSVFYEGARVEGADPATFNVLNAVYARDKSRVYCNGQVLEGADPETFEVAPDEDPVGRDKSNEFFACRIKEPPLPTPEG